MSLNEEEKHTPCSARWNTVVLVTRGDEERVSGNTFVGPLAGVSLLPKRTVRSSHDGK
jgi:hypothetical protein